MEQISRISLLSQRFEQFMLSTGLAQNQFKRLLQEDEASETVVEEDPSADQTLEYGSVTVKDPRDTSLDVMPWTMIVQQDYDSDKISFEITGVPYNGPEPADTFKATVIF